MKDAFGGIANIVLVAIFLVIISGILGLVVNYTKAFRMKNSIISAIEQYEGSKGCFEDEKSGCQELIQSRANRLGYRPGITSCSSEGYSPDASSYFCYKLNNPGKETAGSTNKYSYTIVTQVDIDIPIINKMMGLSIFQVHGDTRPISTWR